MGSSTVLSDLGLVNYIPVYHKFGVKSKAREVALWAFFGFEVALLHEHRERRRERGIETNVFVDGLWYEFE
jgi:hypothetical protein